jgi:hypothetical protein
MAICAPAPSCDISGQYRVANLVEQGLHRGPFAAEAALQRPLARAHARGQPHEGGLAEPEFLEEHAPHPGGDRVGGREIVEPPPLVALRDRHQRAVGRSGALRFELHARLS